MGFMQSPKSLTELEDEKEQTEAEVDVLRQRVLKKQLEAKLGKGAANNPAFKEDSGGGISWKKVLTWLKTH